MLPKMITNLHRPDLAEIIFKAKGLPIPDLIIDIKKATFEAKVLVLTLIRVNVPKTHPFPFNYLFRLFPKYTQFFGLSDFYRKKAEGTIAEYNRLLHFIETGKRDQYWDQVFGSLIIGLISSGWEPPDITD